ncbi:MAG: YceI family protein [Myxococcales bacterium]|nr:YceI family protein [Myxococcales bacterium]
MVIRDGNVHLFTFKDGLLSRLGHDLRFSVERFEISIDGDKVEARFEPDSLRVDGAIQGGQLKAAELSDKDRRDILDNARRKVLDTKRHPTVTWRGTFDSDASKLSGELELAGRRAPLSFALTAADGRLRGRVPFQPSKWGIAPFKALLGALKLKDEVALEFDLADPRAT